MLVTPFLFVKKRTLLCILQIIKTYKRGKPCKNKSNQSSKFIPLPPPKIHFILPNICGGENGAKPNAIAAKRSIGLTFFNGLAVNIGYASPLVDKKLDNGFVNVGLDIPIIEYIGALSKKTSNN